MHSCRYCSAVAHHYGGVGVPYNVSESVSQPVSLPLVVFYSCPRLITCRHVFAGGGGAQLTEGLEYTYVHTPTGETKIGANAAMRVLNDDLHYWCDKATLSAIESGDFFRDYR